MANKHQHIAYLSSAYVTSRYGQTKFHTSPFEILFTFRKLPQSSRINQHVFVSLVYAHTQTNTHTSRIASYDRSTTGSHGWIIDLQMLHGKLITRKSKSSQKRQLDDAEPLRCAQSCSANPTAKQQQQAD